MPAPTPVPSEARATADVRCTADTLVLLRPLDEMEPATRRAVTRWLWEHEVTPSEVAIGWAIQRDPYLGSLVWREDRNGRVVRRWRYVGHVEDASWPAPFPVAALVASVVDDDARLALRFSLSRAIRE